ncbi:hypothetical protein GGF46_005414 [Coemansia sp. RSA 552]|nr:hypothetical protein GGF46_005414 [Coemansia sp. RSA 552]
MTGTTATTKATKAAPQSGLQLTSEEPRQEEPGQQGEEPREERLPGLKDTRRLVAPRVSGEQWRPRPSATQPMQQQQRVGGLPAPRASAEAGNPFAAPRRPLHLRVPGSPADKASPASLKVSSLKHKGKSRLQPQRLDSVFQTMKQ